jgi:hypothetical protein
VPRTRRDYVDGMCIARLQQEHLIAAQALDAEAPDAAPSESAQAAETVPRPAVPVLVAPSSG